HSSVRVLQLRNEQFCFTFVNVQKVILHGFHNRLHNVITRFCQTTEQDNSFRTRESNSVCQCFTQNITCKFENLLSQFISLYGCIVYVFRYNALSRDITQQAGIGTCSEEFACSACHTCSRAVSFQTALASATTDTSVTTNNHVTEFACKTVKIGRAHV